MPKGVHMARTAPTCIIADDHPIVREGMRTRLLELDYRVLGQAESVEEALRLLREHRPSFAVVDYELADGDGLQVVRQAQAEGMPTRFILFTAESRRATIERAFQAGVGAYVGKGSSPEVMAAAVGAVLAGKTYVDPALVGDLIRPRTEALTVRELEVLELLGEGMSNKVIARRLGISLDTTKTHVAAIMRKLEASSRTEAVVQGYRRALLQ